MTTRAWDVRGRLVSSSDTMGHRTETQYDGLDRPRLETRTACADPCEDPSGVPASDDAVTQTTYYPGGQPRIVRNANGARVTYELDGMNRVVGTETVLPEGPVYRTVTEYDGNGNRTSETDRRGVRRLLFHDELNRLERVEIASGSPGGGPYGQIAAYGYDLVGNRTSETDVMGQTTGFVYDDLYRVETKILPEVGPSGNYTETYTYDLVGNRETLTDANGHTTTWAYDGLDRVTLVRNAEGHETEIKYDDPELSAHVNKSEEHDLVRDLRTLFTYDELNREIRREQRLQGPGGDGDVYVTTTTYDDDDHSVLVTDPRQKKTLTFLDGLDRPTVTIADEGDLDLESRLTYDGLGNRKALRDPRGFVTSWIHDGLGRQIALIDAVGEQHRGQLRRRGPEAVGDGPTQRDEDLRVRLAGPSHARGRSALDHQRSRGAGRSSTTTPGSSASSATPGATRRRSTSTAWAASWSRPTRSSSAIDTDLGRREPTRGHGQAGLPDVLRVRQDQPGHDRPQRPHPDHRHDLSGRRERDRSA